MASKAIVLRDVWVRIPPAVLGGCDLRAAMGGGDPAPAGLLLGDFQLHVPALREADHRERDQQELDRDQQDGEEPERRAPEPGATEQRLRRRKAIVAAIGSSPRAQRQM